MGQHTFGRGKQILNLACGSIGVMRQIEYGNLEPDFGAIFSLGRKNDTMRRRVRMLTGLEQVERLEEHSAEPL